MTLTSHEGKVKRVVIHYRKELDTPDRVLESVPGGKAGYYIHTDEQTGKSVGYRVYADNLTVLVPFTSVIDIDANL